MKFEKSSQNRDTFVAKFPIVVKICSICLVPIDTCRWWKCINGMSQSGREGRSSGVELSTADPEPEEMLNMRGKHDNEGHRQYFDNVWNMGILLRVSENFR